MSGAAAARLAVEGVGAWTAPVRGGAARWALELDAVALWWPHAWGAPALHNARLRCLSAGMGLVPFRCHGLKSGGCGRDALILCEGG